MEETGYKVYGFRWAVLVVFGLVLTIQAFIWLTFAPIESSVEQALDVSATLVRLLALIGPFMFIFLASYAGSLADRRGYKFATGVGVVFMISAGVIRAIVPHIVSSVHAQYWIYLVMQALAGAGAVFALVNLSKMPIKWFPENQRGLATGLTTMFLYLGTAIGLPLITVIANIPDDASTDVIMSSLNRVFNITAVLMVVAGIVFFLVAKEEPPTPSGPVPEEEVLPLRESLSRFMRSATFRALALVSLMGYGIYIAMTVTMEKIITRHGAGFTTNFAALVAAGITVGGIIGAAVLPGLSDKIGLRKPFLIMATLVTVPAILIIGLVPNKALGMTAGVLMGFCLMPALPVTFTIVGEMEEIGPKLAGTAVGTLLAFGNIGSVAVPLSMEILARDMGEQIIDYRWSIAMLAAFGIVALAVIIAYVRETGPRIRSVRE